MNYGQKPAVFTGRVPTSYEWSYTPYKWSYNPACHGRGPQKRFLCLSLFEEDLGVDIIFCYWVETANF